MMSIVYIFSSNFYVYLAAFRHEDYGVDYEFNEKIVYSIESLCLLYILLQFFKDKNDHVTQTVEGIDQAGIFCTYLQNEFFWDVVPIIPLQNYRFVNNRERLFFLIKLIRLIKGFQLFDVPQIMRIAKVRQMNKLKKLVEDHPELAIDKD